ncbi:TIGR03943 family putative permease subunit [Streptomyces sp. NPDC057877]|uniref:TIGR03943 family putative permease subunit n=1 Tax=Streptomyces sp. NPDC057877 TaxID=3346269 RepID=UPI0036C72455
MLLLVGGAVLRISLFSELYLRYVQPSLRPYLVVSGGALVLLGVVMVVVVRLGGREEPCHHGHGGRVAWLLVLPALALLLFPPPALGSYSAEREAAQRAARGVGTFPELPDADPVDLTLGEFASRAIYDRERSLSGRVVRMTGFVTRGEEGRTWYLTRLSVACCAADATTGKVRVLGVAAPADDTWVTVTGTWHPEGALGDEDAWPPVLDAVGVKTVTEPANPYEKR